MPILFAQLDDATGSFRGIDGFLGTRGSLMLDLVFLAMFAVVPVMAFSIYLVKYRRKYELHRNIQFTLGIVLLVAVTLFELDIQFVSPWELRAEPSPFFDSERPWTCPAGISLIVHLLFAVPTALLWIYVIVQGLRKFPRPTTPSPYSPRHILLARPAAIGMCLTAVTGWIFYWLAFAS
jgi:uncharacterized membrane protein YozB (DUF420 family)